MNAATIRDARARPNRRNAADGGNEPDMTTTANRSKAAAGPDFGYQVEDTRGQATMLSFTARTKAAENWLAHAAATRLTGISGQIAGSVLRVDPREAQAFFAGFKKAGLTVEGFADKRQTQP